jgi:hypothetical protein
MLESLPSYLTDTDRMLASAFPNGLDDDAYWPLLFLLYENMSDRSLARSIAHFTEKDYYRVLNYIYSVTTLQTLSTEAIERVKQQLIKHGYERWLIDNPVESV